MKMYPLKGSQFSKYEWGKIEDSPCSKEKSIISFPGGRKIHLKNSEISKFFGQHPQPSPVPQEESFPEPEQEPEQVGPESEDDEHILSYE